MSAGTEADDPLAPWLRWRMAWRASRATRTPRWPPRISAPRLPGWQAPQASEAVRNQALDDAEEAVVTLYESDDPVYLPDIALAIRALKTQADKDGGDCAKGAGDVREEFEKWASNPVRAEKLPLERWPKNDGYKDTRTYTAFYGWMGRAALAAQSSGNSGELAAQEGEQ